MKYPFVIAIATVLLFVSCTKDDHIVPPVVKPPQGIDLNISYHVDNAPFVTNSFIYSTQAGYSYNLTTLVYYISEVNLIKADSSNVLIKDYQYLDALSSATNQLSLKDIPVGNYIGLKFNIGLDAIHNKSFALPSTTENVNMQWPDMMGGGYHMMKLEGNYKDLSGTYGFAMHLGTDTCLVPVKLFKSISIIKDAKTAIHLKMNINEWFRNPNQFDFNIDGNYIMGNITNMMKISKNGVDVFSF